MWNRNRCLLPYPIASLVSSDFHRYWSIAWNFSVLSLLHKNHSQFQFHIVFCTTECSWMCSICISIYIFVFLYASHIFVVWTNPGMLSRASLWTTCMWYGHVIGVAHYWQTLVLALLLNNVDCVDIHIQACKTSSYTVQKVEQYTPVLDILCGIGVRYCCLYVCIYLIHWVYSLTSDSYNTELMIIGNGTKWKNGRLLWAVFRLG